MHWLRWDFYLCRCTTVLAVADRFVFDISPKRVVWSTREGCFVLTVVSSLLASHCHS